MLRTLRLAIPLLATLATAACNGNPDETAVECPRPYVLPDAATVARYRGTGRDLSDLVLSVRLIDVQGACAGTLGTHLEGAHAHVVMVVSRGPASQGAQADIPYGLGVVQGGNIRDAARYVQHVVFPPNVNTVQLNGQEIQLKLPTPKGVTGPSYHLYFWLQLTPEELAANRRPS